MAELLIKINDGASYKDGDIVDVFNDERIKRIYARVISHPCHVMWSGGGADVHRPDGIARTVRELCYEWRWERVSRTTVKRVNLATLEEAFFGPDPDPIYGTRVNVPMYFANKLKHERHDVFGVLGREIYYSGKIDESASKLTEIWNAIETETPLREIDHRIVDLGTLVYRNYLALSVNDFNNTEAGELVEPELDLTDPENPVVVRSRKRFVDWPTLFPMNVPPTTTANQVRDKTRSIDVRAKIQNRANIVEIRT